MRSSAGPQGKGILVMAMMVVIFGVQSAGALLVWELAQWSSGTGKAVPYKGCLSPASGLGAGCWGSP